MDFYFLSLSLFVSLPLSHSSLPPFLYSAHSFFFCILIEITLYCYKTDKAFLWLLNWLFQVLLLCVRKWIICLSKIFFSEILFIVQCLYIHDFLNCKIFRYSLVSFKKSIDIHGVPALVNNCEGSVILPYLQANKTASHSHHWDFITQHSKKHELFSLVCFHRLCVYWFNSTPPSPTIPRNAWGVAQMMRHV